MTALLLGQFHSHKKKNNWTADIPQRNCDAEIFPSSKTLFLALGRQEVGLITVLVSL